MSNLYRLTPLSNGDISFLFGNDERTYRLSAAKERENANVLKFTLADAVYADKVFEHDDCTIECGMSLEDAFLKVLVNIRDTITRSLEETGLLLSDNRKCDLKHLLRQMGRAIAKLSIQIAGGWAEPTCIRFTFGSDQDFDYGEGQYVEVYGLCQQDCLETFRLHHPNRKGSTALNCTSYYRTQFWPPVKAAHYEDMKPVQVLVSESLYGSRPEGFEPLWFYVPEKDAIVRLQEGPDGTEGAERLENGAMDYLEYEVHYIRRNLSGMSGYGTDMLPIRNMVQEHYACLADAIPDILNDAWQDPLLTVQLLEQVR